MRAPGTGAVRAAALGLAAAVAVAGAIAWARWNRDEARIARALADLVRNAGKDGREGAVAAAARAQAVADAFAEEAETTTDLLPVAVNGRSEIASAVFQSRAAFDAIRIELYDRTLELDGPRGAATMRLTAVAHLGREGATERVVREFELDWSREPEGWRVRAARTVAPLRRLPGPLSAPRPPG